MNKELKRNLQKFLNLKGIFSNFQNGEFKMSVEDDLLKIKEIKKSLNLAIRAKGSDIADDTKFDQYPVKIDGIETGGSTYKIENGVLNSISKMNLSGKFDDIETISSSGLRYVFYNVKELENTELAFPKLVTIGTQGMAMTFSYVQGLKSISFPKLTTIEFNGMQDTFLGSSIEQIFFPELVSIEDGGMSGTFNTMSALQSDKLNSVTFPKLKSVGQSGMSNCFSGQTSNFKSVEFPELESIGQYSFEETFKGCKSLQSCTFPKLKEVGNYGLSYCFDSCERFSEISFPNLTTVQSNSFENAFKYCYSLEIHFPASIQSTIEACTGYSDKFGARNSTIYFDL